MVFIEIILIFIGLTLQQNSTTLPTIPQTNSPLIDAPTPLNPPPLNSPASLNSPTTPINSPITPLNSSSTPLNSPSNTLNSTPSPLNYTTPIYPSNSTLNHTLTVLNFSVKLEYPGYVSRCFMYLSRFDCFADVSCVWCVSGALGKCIGKDTEVLNSTKVLSSCSRMYYLLTQQENFTCDSLYCQECSGDNCLAKTCGLPDGQVDGPITRESCNPWEMPCYWCSKDKGGMTSGKNGVCYTEVDTCKNLRSASFGSCSSIDCINRDESDGNFLVPFERDAVMGVRLFTSFLSLLGTTFLMFSILFFKKFRYLSVRLIFFLSVSCFLDSCANLFSIGVYNRDVELITHCYAQGTILQFSSISIFCWIIVISFNLYFVVVFNKKRKYFEVLYHLFVWTLAGLAAGLPWLSKAYGIAGLWCWIIWDYQIYRWLLFYVPLFLVFLGVILFYSLIYSHILGSFRAHGKDISREAKYLLKKLRIYPLVFIVVYLFLIINRIYDWASPDDSFPLYVLESLTTPLLGFIYSLMFTFDPETRALWKKQLFNMGLCVSLTAPMNHEEFQDEDDKQKKSEINFDVPDVKSPPLDEEPDLF